MDFRLAAQTDLPRLKAMYRRLIEHMDQNGVSIWDDVYPCEYLAGDIADGALHVLADGDHIAAAFALCESNDGAVHVTWQDARARALYLDRFGVNVDDLRRGVGSTMLHCAMDVARQKGAAYLRLFVVDINLPAIRLYRKNGFQQADGVYEEVIDDDFALREYGFEIELLKDSSMMKGS